MSWPRAYFGENKSYFFSGPVIFMLWSFSRPGSAANRSDGFRRHIKSSRSVQNGAVVASEHLFERRKSSRETKSALLPYYALLHAIWLSYALLKAI